MFVVQQLNSSTVIFTDGLSQFTAIVKKTLTLSIGCSKYVFPVKFLTSFYGSIEEIIGYHDLDYTMKNGGIQFFSLRTVDDVISISLYNDNFTFAMSDIPAFKKFFLTVQKMLLPLIKNNKLFLIWNSNHKFINSLTKFDMAKVVETMISVANVQKLFHVFPYPGQLNLKNLSSFQKHFPINEKYRYNIGIFCIFDEGFHYLTFVLDTIVKDVWLFDSLSTDAVFGHYGFAEMIKAIYPDYKVYGTCILTGQIKKFEPLHGDVIKLEIPNGGYTDQNIYCHTWCLWFLYQCIHGIRLKNTLNEIVLQINVACRSPRENLIRIKQFAHWLAKDILEVGLPVCFDEILNLDGTVEKIEWEDVEMIV